MPKFDLSLLPPRPDLSFERELWGCGIQRVAGVDEAGRGPLAGPVAAGAVILPSDDLQIEQILCLVDDSKQLTAAEREACAGTIKAAALAWAVGFASVEEIDRLGIAPATRLAMQRALAELCQTPEHLLLDFVHLPEVSIPQTPLVKGDARSLSIASASVLAKTARDAIMGEQDACYPGYGFAAHKGYATPQHLQALKQLGPCTIHRRSFEPVKGMLLEGAFKVG